MQDDETAVASPDPEINHTGDWSGRVVTYEDFAIGLAIRRKALGEPEVLRNAGTRRTASKRALLKALERLDAKW